MPKKVTVYFFTHVDDDVNADQVSKRMAPAEKIARVHGGKLDVTALEIDDAELDQYGFYVPRSAKDLEEMLYQHSMGEGNASDTEMLRAEAELKALDAVGRR
jgi:hypothetical protein